MKKSIVFILLTIIFTSTVMISSCADKGTGDGELPMDGVEHRSMMLSDDYFYGMINDRAVYYSIYDPENKYYACADALCQHIDSSCPGYSNRTFHLLIVDTEERSLPLIYMFGFQDPFIYKDGETVVNPDHMLCVVRELDMSTDEGRVVSDELPFSNASTRLYYNGKLYITADYHTESKVGAIDVVTGEYKEIDYEEDASVLGIYDSHLYFMTSGGLILRCDLELQNAEEVYDCGKSFLRNGEIKPMSHLKDGVVYFERDCRYVTDEETGEVGIISDVYAVDLDDIEAGAELLVEGVLYFYPHEGDIYYTQWDYEYLGTFDTTYMGSDIPIAIEGGKILYKYDGETKESSVFINDCGAAFANIYEFNDKYIMFTGYHYDDIDSLGEEGLYRSGFGTLLMYSFETGTYEIIVETLVGDVAIQ